MHEEENSIRLVPDETVHKVTIKLHKTDEKKQPFCGARFSINI